MKLFNCGVRENKKRCRLRRRVYANKRARADEMEEGRAVKISLAVKGKTGTS